MGWARWWAGEVTCDLLMTGKLSAVACAAKESTNCQRCIPLVGLRQRRRLAVHLLLERLRVFRRELDSYTLRNRESVRRRSARHRVAVRGRAMYRKCQVVLTLFDKKCQIFTTYTCHE